MDQLYKRLHSSWIRPLQLRIRGAGNGELSRERNQAIVRLTVQLAVLVYFIAREVPLHFSFFAFIGAGVAILILVYLTTAASVLRRTVTNVFDVSMTSFVMVYVGEAAVPLFLLYLWITLGNGLRFGLRAMAISAALSFLGFSVVLGLSPIWQGLVPVALAVMAALLVLPMTAPYIRSLTLRKQQAATNQDSFLVDRVPRDAQPPPHLLGRERSQAITRLVISAVVTVYLVISFQPVSLLTIWFLFCLGYLVFSVLIVTLALHDTEHSVPRRTLSNIADASAISYLMVATGQMGFPLFVLYLWITLGNGFRYGITAMLVSSALSVAGFSVVVAVSDLWREHHMLAAGVLTGLIVIPGYAAHLIRHLHEARRRAEEASAAKGNFLARMSHELRTPLNGILGTAELLGASKRLTREDRSLLEVIKDSVHVSMRQIDNVLDFSKIEAGKLLVDQAGFDLHELLNRASRLVRALALEKNLRLTLRIDPAIPHALMGDPHHVHEALLNLLSNAIKFTDKGYVSLEAHLLQEDAVSVLVRFEVHDTGVGIEPAALERIFEAFSQEDTGTTRRYGGTGLGTTIAKQLVELMGGQLWAESTKGKGSRFFADIRFPRQAGDQDLSTAVLHGSRILVISADPELCRHVARAVIDWGVSVVVVRTAAEAVGLLARGIRLGNPIDAVLADSRAVFNDSGVHCGQNFLEKAALSLTPVFLLADVAPEQPQLRTWGYAAVLSYDLPRSLLFSALRSASVYDSSNSERGVVQVEPLAWGQSGRVRPKLLVADDNRTNLMILRKILEAASYDIDTAENGEQALELLLRGRYKAAILDMHMPGLDGVAVIKQYRVLRAGVRVPIIMLTANATIDAKLQSAEAGADAYLTKPATSSEVLSTIKKLVDDTEVQTLPTQQVQTTAVQEPMVLDKEVIKELDRLYGSPAEVSRLLDTFEFEGRRLLYDLGVAIVNKNHAAFCDLIHALKGNGANVGAVRLVQACREVEGCGMLDFRRDGKQMLARLEGVFAEVSTALREFTAVGETNPARGTDLH